MSARVSITLPCVIPGDPIGQHRHVSDLVYGDGARVTFEFDARAEMLDHDALLQLGVDYAREQQFFPFYPHDVRVPNLSDPGDAGAVREWALCFVRDRITNYERLDTEFAEQIDRRRLLGLAVMGWLETRWPELRVTASDMERWRAVTDRDLAADRELAAEAVSPPTDASSDITQGAPTRKQINALMRRYQNSTEYEHSGRVLPQTVLSLLPSVSASQESPNPMIWIRIYHPIIEADCSSPGRPWTSTVKLGCG